MAVVAKNDRTIGAPGARWGLNTERSFRDALAAILEKSFEVEVINVDEFDDEGGGIRTSRAGGIGCRHP